MTAQQAKAALREMFLKTLPRLDVGAKMREMVRLCDGVLHVAGDRFPLHPGRPVRVVAAGKAALAMTAVLSEIMDGVRLRGVVAAPSLPPEPLPGFDYFQGGHPYPNLQSWESATEALTLLNQKNLRADDLVVFLISGGGSSLMEMPPSNSIRPEDLRAFYELLVTCGAGIREINTVRKHFSRIKGGRLAQAAHPARQITLYVSDVPEDSPAMVASGPTMPDETTAADCEEVLSRYKLLPVMPASYQAEWRASSARSRATPKPGDPCFAQSRYYCLLSNWNGLELLEEMAGAHGINCDIDTRCDDWPVARAADHLLACLEKLRQENPGAPVALISGGELSSPVSGAGVGGRNQAFVLECVPKIAGKPIAVLSAGTDGIDGNSPAAGAVAAGDSLERARALGLDPGDYQRRSDSHRFFDRLGDAIVTGPTGTNVRDLRILLAY